MYVKQRVSKMLWKFPHGSSEIVEIIRKLVPYGNFKTFHWMHSSSFSVAACTTRNTSIESTIIKVIPHIIRHFKADKFCQIYLFQIDWFSWPYPTRFTDKRSKVIRFLFVLWPLNSLDSCQSKQCNQDKKFAMKTYSTINKL